jgi:hypothetical protein
LRTQIAFYCIGGKKDDPHFIIFTGIYPIILQLLFDQKTSGIASSI